MGLISPMSLIDPNSTVTIQTPTVSVAGGVTQAWANTVVGVLTLITQASGSRNPKSGGDFETDGYTISGIDAALTYTHSRIKVTAFTSRPELVGRFFRVESTATHPAGQEGLADARIGVKITLLNIPADGATT